MQDIKFLKSEMLRLMTAFKEACKTGDQDKIKAADVAHHEATIAFWEAVYEKTQGGK